MTKTFPPRTDSTLITNLSIIGLVNAKILINLLTKTLLKTKAELNLNEHPPIIVRFSNRDKRNELFAKRRTPKSSVNSTSTDNQNTTSINFTLRENLTKYRKMLFNEAKKFKLSMKYQFLWTWQGQIMIRKTERSKIWKISSLRDLANIQKFAGGETSFV